jgi:hypothetical protein
MIYAFLCGVKCKKTDWEVITKIHTDYRTAFKLGYWVRVNLLRINK